MNILMFPRIKYEMIYKSYNYNEIYDQPTFNYWIKKKKESEEVLIFISWTERFMKRILIHTDANGPVRIRISKSTWNILFLIYAKALLPKKYNVNFFTLNFDANFALSISSNSMLNIKSQKCHFYNWYSSTIRLLEVLWF